MGIGITRLGIGLNLGCAASLSDVGVIITLSVMLRSPLSLLSRAALEQLTSIKQDVADEDLPVRVDIQP